MSEYVIGRRKSRVEAITDTVFLGGALALFGAAIGGAGFGVYWVGEKVVGSYGSPVPKQEAVSQALSKYDTAFTHASPAGKFITEYLRRTTVDTTEYPHPTGLDGWGQGPQYQVHFNDGCLYNTAYDISGGSIHATIEGLFSYANISGNSPSAAAFAEINPQNPDDLIVQSGHTNSVNLMFSGLEGDKTSLTPANQQTKNILETYGCKVGVMGIDSSY
jgi:hypothetical protein